MIDLFWKLENIGFFSEEFYTTLQRSHKQFISGLFILLKILTDCLLSANIGDKELKRTVSLALSFALLSLGV